MRKAAATSDTSRRPRLRRGYFESRFGQLHVHNAIPAGGGFDEGTSLICLHATPRSGACFLPLLELMGTDRSVYAPDLPGYGGSDGPPAPPAIADYAGAIGDFCTSMRFRQVDVLGWQTGALAAVELALLHPGMVRRVVLVSPPLPGVQPTQPEAVEDGSHLVPAWRRLCADYPSGTPLATVARAFADQLAGGANGAWGLAAASQYPARERAALLAQPCLLLRPHDEGHDAVRARDLLPRARVAELPAGLGAQLFDIGAEPVARALKDFLRG
ncbi:MAG TPA: alpha/beta fold hydrolase [Steroidobacteraceae bacterium]|nr:alpha/beta fold hydrolase [Steroidobacteraceae bacterium]